MKIYNLIITQETYNWFLGIVASYTNKEMAQLHLKKVRQEHRNWQRRIDRRVISPTSTDRYHYPIWDQGHIWDALSFSYSFRIVTSELNDHPDQYLGHYGDQM